MFSKSFNLKVIKTLNSVVKAHRICQMSFIPRSRSSVKVNVKYQRTLLVLKHSLFNKIFQNFIAVGFDSKNLLLQRLLMTFRKMVLKTAREREEMLVTSILNLSQKTNFRLFQIERVCRRHFQI